MVSGLGRLTMWNESIPTSLRGRLAGIEMLSYASGPTLGNVESGVVNTFAGLQATIVSGGVIGTVGTGLLALALPAFWKYDSAEGRLLRRSDGGPDGEASLLAADAPEAPEAPSDTMVTPAPSHSPYLGRPSDEAGPGGRGRGVQ